MVKIEDKPVEAHKKAKDIRNGAKKWKHCHLPDYPDSKKSFANEVVPLACKKTGTLEPWELIKAEDLQLIVNQVYPEKQYTVEMGNVWYQLVPYHNILSRPLSLTQFLDEDAPQKLAQQICK